MYVCGGRPVDIFSLDFYLTHLLYTLYYVTPLHPRNNRQTGRSLMTQESTYFLVLRVAHVTFPFSIYMPPLVWVYSPYRVFIRLFVPTLPPPHPPPGVIYVRQWWSIAGRLTVLHHLPVVCSWLLFYRSSYRVVVICWMGGQLRRQRQEEARLFRSEGCHDTKKIGTVPLGGCRK